jgi:hypothetical protein
MSLGISTLGRTGAPITKAAERGSLPDDAYAEAPCHCAVGG